MASAGRIALILLSVPLGILIISLGFLLIVSPGNIRPISDGSGSSPEGSISEKIHIHINGVPQGMFLRGSDTRNPVLLFVHGGTGMPEYFLTRKYPTGLENYFTVCWWDRRGAGLSYSADIPPESLNIEQFVSDAIEVTNYLRARFGKEKIYLMAHSGGTLFGIQTVARAPWLYHAYIGVGQMTWQLRSEKLSYDYMLERYRELGNHKMIKKFEAAPVEMSLPLPEEYMKLRDKAMHELGFGTTKDMKSVISGVLLESWLNPEYTIQEKLGIWRGKFNLDRLLWNKMLAMDLTKLVTKLDLPVYFFHGKYDQTVSYPLAKAYLDSLQAPLKGFYSFENSAHSPMFEEPQKMKQIILKDVFGGNNSLADEN